MSVKSPLHSGFVCQRIGNISIEELKRCYKDGNGLGLDLLNSIKVSIIGIYRCPLTRYIFFYPENLAGDAFFYKELEGRSPQYYNTDSWEFHKAFELVQKDEKLLEIGSGNLSFLKLIKGKTVNLVGLELNQTSVAKGIEEGFEMYNESIHEFSKTHKKVFDVVCSFQVLEHISDVADFISSSLRSLKKGGRLIFAVPNNNAIYFRERKILKYYSKKENYILHCTTIALNSPPHHMGLWNERSLKNLAKIYPVKIKSIHKEKLADFRVGLIQDILVSRVSKFLGLKLSKKMLNFFSNNGFIKKYYIGDSILIELEKK